MPRTVPSQAAAALKLSWRTGPWVRPSTARVYTHRHHLLLLLSPKANTHFTVRGG